ncbi:hypothetical protein Htur_0920 [Haloterrigena turkmenica DSM 5511]|uniref:Uncharacterized protein n=1 Tax=Haloterrigena turkmenica (strain ATCC 51198 / DSM 5511 / JCM 9101 / NCIMB 13204 / VKM B-1734 / 4k) TaxID=543526 RepID=D2RXY0_HALTV|nr:hypothetical protein [Haloterrigena turkmenica]ADB59814.1 hypothetical protein Htur_0920 [Haloterrigena turkmenica DSM 5511]
MATPVVISTVSGQVSEFWVFYRRYTDTTIHTAATAALTIFGLLIFLDPWFAVLAIGSYVGPPVVLYALADERIPDASNGEPQQGRPANRADRTVDAAPSTTSPNRSSGADSRANSRVRTGNGDTDSDSDDGDTDSDSDGTDTDSDSDGTDTDTDSDDGDTDSDSDS